MARSVTLEIDKFQGTPFPPSAVNIEGKEYRLDRIFTDAGLDLEVKTNEVDIVDPLGGQDAAYSIPELDNLMQDHRNRLAINNERSLFDSG
jgi:hypothetical protein